MSTIYYCNSPPHHWDEWKPMTLFNYHFTSPLPLSFSITTVLTRVVSVKLHSFLPTSQLHYNHPLYLPPSPSDHLCLLQVERQGVSSQYFHTFKKDKMSRIPLMFRIWNLEKPSLDSKICYSSNTPNT